MTHANEEMLRSTYDAFVKGDVPAVLSNFSDDIVFSVPGRSLVAGTYKGKDEVVGFFGKLINLSDGTFSLEVLDVLANDRHGAVLTMERGQRNGRDLENRAVHRWNVEDGKCVSFQGYNEEGWDPFWP